MTGRRQPPRLKPATTDAFVALLGTVDGQWSQPSTYAATGAHHGYRRVVVVHAGELLQPQFGPVLEPFAPVAEAWLSWLDPDGFIVPHIDPGPHLERWQIPLTENGTLTHGDAPVGHTVGVPFRVHHDDWHSVSNSSDRPRISLVIDRDVIVNSTRSPFRKAGDR